MLEIIECKLPTVTVKKIGLKLYILTPFDYLVATSLATTVPIKLIISRDRLQDIKNARHIYCYITRANTKYSLSEIGKEIGRDHTTVLYSHKKIKNWLEIPAYEKELKLVIDEILENL